MSQVLIAAPFLISFGFVLGTIWKLLHGPRFLNCTRGQDCIFKREDDAIARIEAPRHYTRLKV